MSGKITEALAKAQAEFGAVVKDKHVKITTLKGGTYEFDYAPLDTILASTRGPLTSNGLALVQMLDDGKLVTTLYHTSGESITGAIDVPHTEDIKSYGSAITYLRRYAIQALLGIAAEDDDDGSRATGDGIAAPEAKGAEQLTLLGNLQKAGTLLKGTAAQFQGEWREEPTGHAIGLRMKLDGDDRDIPQVLIRGPIGEALYATGTALEDVRVTVKGRLYDVRAKGRRSYYRLVVGENPEHDFISGPDWRVPAVDEPPAEAESAPMFSEDEQAALDAAVDAVLA